jgi:nucleoside-diphosphate-sugar epimerase
LIVAITGASSSIGKYLSGFLTQSGHRVIAVGRQESFCWRLGEALPINLEADVLIHLAHDRKLSLEDNISAVRLILDSFNGHFLFLSSLSAHSKSKSLYGKSKYVSEDLFLQAKATVIRAGVVYGPGILGVHHLLERLKKSLPILPLPYLGLSRFFVSHIDDLCEEVHKRLLLKDNVRVFAAHIWPYSIRKLITLIPIGSAKIRKQILIPLPTKIMKLLLLPLQGLAQKISVIDSLISLDSEINNLEISRLTKPLTEFRQYEP